MKQKKTEKSNTYELGREFASASFVLPEHATQDDVRAYVRDKLAYFTKEFVSGPAQKVDEFTEELEGEDVPQGWWDALLDRIVPLSFTRIRARIKVRRVERVVQHTTKVMNVCGHLAAQPIDDHAHFLVSSPTYHLKYRPVTEYLRQGAHDDPILKEVMEAAWEFGGGRAGWSEVACKIADFIDGRAKEMTTMEDVAGQLEALENTVKELGNLVLGIELRRDFITTVQTAALCLPEEEEGDLSRPLTTGAEQADAMDATELVALALEVDAGQIPLPDEHPEKFVSFVEAFVDIATGLKTAEESGFPYLVEFFSEQPEEEDEDTDAQKTEGEG